VLTSAREFALFGQLYLNRALERAAARQRGIHPPGHGQRPLLARVRPPRQDDFRRRGYGWLMFRQHQRIWEGVDRRGFGFLAPSTTSAGGPVPEFVFVRMVTPEEQKNHKDYENAWT